MTKTRTLTVTIGAAPDSLLRPNARPNRYAKARLARQEREAALHETREQVLYESRSVDVDLLREDPGPIAVETTIGWPKGRKFHDGDGAEGACKAIYDGIAQALGVNDVRFRHAPTEQERTDDRRGWVRVTLRWEA